MAVIKKTLFDEHLEKINVLVNDVESDSKYFKITELPNTFTGGKNAFLIQGSDYLVGDTLVKIQIKDSKGDIIYYEPGQGIPEYYEGTSKVVSVYIYPDTAYGPCTITILGELNEYDSNGFKLPIPDNWKDTYNVKWTKQINVNPSLPNVTKIRFFRRPEISIYESIQPLYTRTITRSTLSTGTIKGVSINPAAGTNYKTYAGETNYQLQLTGASFSSSMVGETINVTGLPQLYTPIIENVINSSTVKVAIPYYETSSAAATEQIIKEFSGKPYSLQYTSNTVYSSSFLSSSYASITLTNLETFTGDANRIKISAKSLNQNAGYKLLDDFTLESSELLITSSYNRDINVRTGLFRTQDIINTFWTQSIISGTTSLTPTYDNTTLVASVKLLGSTTENTTNLPRNKFTTNNSTPFLKNTEYQLDYTPLLSSSLYENNKIEIYASGSAFLDSNTYKIGKLIDTTSAKSLFQRYDKKQINFKPDQDGAGKIVFVIYQGQWQLTDISLRASSETFFSPNEINVNVNVPTVIPNETFDFKFEFYDINNNLVYPLTVEKQYTFTGGNDTIVGTITIVNNNIADLSGSVSGNIAAVSSSISGTMTVYSSSASSSVGRLSGSVSGTIGVLSGSVSGTIGVLSGSVSGTIGNVSSSISGTMTVYSSSASGSIGALSGSVSASIAKTLLDSFAKVQQLANGGYPGTFIENNSIYSPVIGGQLGYFSTLFKVGKSGSVEGPSIYLDARQNPRKIFIGGATPAGETEASGAFNSTNTSVYLDSTGKFSLKDKLTWNGSALTVVGSIDITGGSAQTQISNAALSGSNAQTTADAAATAAGSAAAAAAAAENKIFTDAAGKVVKAAAPSGKGLFLSSTHLGYYNTTDFPSSPWRTYMSSSGDFFLNGTGSNGLTWNAGTNALTIDGNITARNGTFIGNITSTATISGGTLSGGTITGGTIRIGSGTSVFSADGNGLYLGNTTFASSPFRVTPAGALTATGVNITGNLTATGGTFGGWTIDNNLLKSNSNAIILDGGNNSISMTVGGLTRFNLNTGSVLPDPNITGGGTISIAGVSELYQGVGSVQYNSNAFTAPNSVITNFVIPFVNTSAAAEYGGSGTSDLELYYRIRNITTNTIVTTVVLLGSAAAQGGDNTYSAGSISGGGVYQSYSLLNNATATVETQVVAGHQYRAELYFEYSTPVEGTLGTGTASYVKIEFSTINITVAVQVATVVINGGGFLSAVNAGKFLQMSNTTPDAVTIGGGIKWDKVDGRPGYVARAWVVATWSARDSPSNYASATIKAGANVLAVGRNNVGWNSISFTSPLPKGNIGGYGDYDTMGAAFASGLRRYSGAGANSNEYQIDIACNPIFGGGSSVMVYTYDNNRDVPENVNLLNVVIFA